MRLDKYNRIQNKENGTLTVRDCIGEKIYIVELKVASVRALIRRKCVAIGEIEANK